MAASSYGAYQPGAVDPWSIESELAKASITSPADAQGMLSSYAQQRQAQSYLYGQEAERQHDFAKQQLAQQMAEARMKTITEMAGKTGANAFLAGGGIEGIGPSAGGNPAAWAGYGQAGQQHDFAQNFAEEGKGAESFSRAGQDVALQQIPGLQNFQTTGAGEHSDITTERIKADVALRTAAMKAKAGGNGDGTGLTISGTVPNAYGTDDHFSAGKKVSEAKINAFREAHGLHRIDPQTPAQPLPDAGNARASANSRTSLAPASGPPQNAAAGVPAMQQRVVDNEAGMRRANPTLFNDYTAGKARNNGKPDVRIEGGKAVLYGGSGKPLAQVNG